MLYAEPPVTAKPTKFSSLINFNTIIGDTPGNQWKPLCGPINPSDICLCLSLTGISRKDQLLEEPPVYYEGAVQFVCKYLAIQLAQLRAPLGEKLAKTFQLPLCN